MTLSDVVNYTLFTNPVSSTLISGANSIAKSTGLKKTSIQTQKIYPPAPPMPLWTLIGHNKNFIRIAGISGAAAVMLGAYGAHVKFPDDKDNDLHRIFDIANRFHFFHSLALLAVPLTHRPLLSGTLLATGMILFCGPCYYSSLTGEKTFNKLAPFGGLSLMLAWVTMIF